LQCSNKRVAEPWWSIWYHHWSCCSSSWTWTYSLWFQWI